MFKQLILSGIVVILSTIVSYSATVKGLYYCQSVGIGYNPLGLVLDSRFLYRFPLPRQQGRLWENTRLDIGIRNELTPTDDLLAVAVTFVPLALFELTLKGGPYLIYDQLGFGYVSFNDKNQAYDPKAIDSLECTTRLGFWVSANPTVRLKLGSVIAAHSLTVDYYAMGTGTEFFLERRSYSLRKVTDVDFVNETVLLYEFNTRIMAGVAYRNQQVAGTGFASQRLGAITVLNPTVKRFQRAFCVAMAGVYLQDKVFKYKPFVALKSGFDLKIHSTSKNALNKT